MEVVRCPDPKRIQDLSPDELREHCYRDIMSRPGWYFPGWNSKTHTFGKKFHRSEFNLDEIVERYQSVYYEIADTAFRSKTGNAFSKNYKACYRPFPCEFIPLCLFNVMSETVFTIKKKPVFTVPVDPGTVDSTMAGEVETAVQKVDQQNKVVTSKDKYKENV